MNEDTKNVPTLTNREKVTIKRFETYHACARLLKDFFYKGFRSYQALKAISSYYYPDVDTRKLKDVWNFNAIHPEITEILENVYEQLKKE